jgi:DNA processing protein
MVTQGAVISEVPLGTPATRPRFPARNRLISGLALGVVVTEAPERSGALITAEFAAEQGRQVFAVPGSFNSEFSRGTHALLRDGARLVESVADIVDELDLPPATPAPPVVGGGHRTPAAAAPPLPAPSAGGGPRTPPTPLAAPQAHLTAEEQALLEALSLQQRHVDDIIEHCRIPSSRASAGLLMLELKGLVRRLPGNMFMRVQ